MSSRDTARLHDVWFCAVLVFAGYEVCSIEEIDKGKYEYIVACPQLDYDDLMQQYLSEEGLPLSSAKAFVAAFNSVVNLQKKIRGTGRTWVADRWVSGKIG